MKVAKTASRADDSNPCKQFGSILTREQADGLVTAALFTDYDEPEPFVKLLLVLYDNSRESVIREALHQLMRAAYDASIVHSSDFQEYLEAIRQGRNPLEEHRSRRSAG